MSAPFTPLLLLLLLADAAGYATPCYATTLTFDAAASYALLMPITHVITAHAAIALQFAAVVDAALCCQLICACCACYYAR